MVNMVNMVLEKAVSPLYILNVFHNILNYLSEDETTYVDIVYFDYAKVFEKLDHGIVIHTARDFSIGGHLESSAFD